MLNGKNFKKLMVAARERRREADRASRTVLSPWPWTSEERTKEEKEYAVYSYFDALDALKIAEASVPREVSTDKKKYECDVRLHGIEKMRGEIYKGLTRITGSKEFAARARRSAGRAQKILQKWPTLNESKTLKRMKSAPLTSGMTDSEIFAARRAGFFKNAVGKPDKAVSRLLDGIIEENNKKLGPGLVNEKLGKNALKYEDDTLKLDPFYLLKGHSVVLEKDGKTVAVPLKKDSADKARDRATTLVETTVDYQDMLSDVPRLDIKLANTNFFRKLEKGPVVLDDYSDLFTFTRSVAPEKLKKKLVRGTSLKWQNNELVTKKPVDKKTLKKDLRKIQSRADELAPALGAAGIPINYSLGGKELNGLFPRRSGAALAAVMGLGIPPVPHKRRTYDGKVMDFEGSESPSEFDVKKDTLHPMQRPESVQRTDQPPSVSFTTDGPDGAPNFPQDQRPVQGVYAPSQQEASKPILKNGKKNAYEIAGMALVAPGGTPVSTVGNVEIDETVIGMLSASKSVTEDSLNSISSGAEEDVEVKLHDLGTHPRTGLTVGRLDGKYTDLIVFYKAKKNFRNKFLEPALIDVHRTVEQLYQETLQNWNGERESVWGIENYMDPGPKIRELRKKDKRKKGIVAGSLISVLSLLGGGLYNYVSHLPHGKIVVPEDVPGTLNPIDDINITEGQDINLTLKATAPADYSLMARLAWASNNTTIKEVPLSPSDGAYVSQLLLPGLLFPYKKTMLDLSLLRDKDADGSYETFDNLIHFNVSKRHKINLPPEIIPKLNKVGKADYGLEIVTQDASGDEIPGTGDVEAYLDGVLLAAKEKSLKLNFSLEKEGDHELEVRAYDAANHSIESVWKTALHKNYRPQIEKVTVTKVGHDLYETEISYFDKDGTITKIPFRVGRDNNTILYEELEPQVQNGTIKVPLDLTGEHPGNYTIEVHALDDKGDVSDTAAAQAVAENDKITFTVNSIDKVSGQNDTWSYDVDWSKPDGSAYSVKVGFAQPDNDTNEKENTHVNDDTTKRSGKVTGQLDMSKSYPEPRERDLTIKGIDEYGELTEYRAGKVIELENNKAWVWSQVLSENNNATGNNFIVKLTANDEDTATVNLSIVAERSGADLKDYSEDMDNKTFSRTLSFDFSDDEPGPVEFKGYLTDSVGSTYQVFSHNVSVQDDPIEIKDPTIRYNPLPAIFGGKKLNISANLSNPDDDVSSAVLKLENASASKEAYEFPLVLKGSGRERSVQEEVDISAVPSGDYKYYITATGAKGLKTVQSGQFTKNESYEIEETSGTQPGVKWDYKKNKALLTTITDTDLKQEELDDYQYRVPSNIKTSLQSNWPSLVNPGDPLTTAKNLQPWLDGFIPGVPGYEDDKAYARNMTAIFRHIADRMSKNGSLTPQQRALWNRSFAVPLTKNDNWFEALVSVDTNNDSVFDRMNEQILLQQGGWIQYRIALGGNQYVPESGYSTSYDKSSATDRLLFNRYDLGWTVPKNFDVDKASEQDLCDRTTAPTPENVTMLSELEKAMIGYGRLGALEPGQKLVFKYDNNLKTYRKFVESA